MVAAMGIMPIADAVVETGSALPVGAPVIDAAGEKLGSVTGITADGLIVEQGIFFVTTRVVPEVAVARVEDETIWLKWTKAELDQAG